MGLAQSEPDAVDFLKGPEEFGFGERPNLRRRRRGTSCEQEAIDGSAGGFVGAFHGREIGVGADVVRGEEQVEDFDLGFGTVLEGTDRIDQQWLQIRRHRWVGKLDIGVEKPGDEIRIIELDAAVCVEVLF